MGAWSLRRQYFCMGLAIPLNARRSLYTGSRGSSTDDFLGEVFGLVRAAGGGERPDTRRVRRTASHEFEGASTGEPWAPVQGRTAVLQDLGGHAAETLGHLPPERDLPGQVQNRGQEKREGSTKALSGSGRDNTKGVPERAARIVDCAPARPVH